MPSCRDPSPSCFPATLPTSQREECMEPDHALLPQLNEEINKCANCTVLWEGANYNSTRKITFQRIKADILHYGFQDTSNPSIRQRLNIVRGTYHIASSQQFCLERGMNGVRVQNMTATGP
jgi:hypothetical protein